jgi:hypothetical protein
MFEFLSKVLLKMVAKSFKFKSKKFKSKCKKLKKTRNLKSKKLFVND